MVNLNNITLLVPNNDLESRTIIEIARKMGFSDNRLLISGQPWGARLEQEPKSTFDRIGTEIVWIVEIPGPAKESELREKGHQVVIIDHHTYNDMAEDRYSPLSSLEQFAQKCDYKLTREEELIAVNDRGYIWGLIEKEATYEQIMDIRKKDLTAQGYTSADFAACISEYKNQIAEKIKKDRMATIPIIYHTTTLERFGHLQDLFHLPDAEALANYKKAPQKYARRNLFIFRNDPAGGLASVHFSGSTHYIDPLFKGFKERAVSMWRGGNGAFGYAGCRLKPQAVEASQRLDTMPIQKFNSIFLYPFYHGNPPVDTRQGRWRSESFKIPTDEGGMFKANNKWELRQNYAEYVYFHEYVRPFLFQTETPQGSKKKETTNSDIRYYRYNLEKPLRVQLETVKADKKGKLELNAYIIGISAHLCPGGIGIMAVETSNAPDSFDDFEHLDQDETPLICTGEEVLLFNNMFRRLYPSYFEKSDFTDSERLPTQMENREFPVSVKMDLPVSTNFRLQSTHLITGKNPNQPHTRHATLDRHWLSGILGDLFQENRSQGHSEPSTLGISPIIDDRMFVHTYVAFPEALEKMADDKHQKIFFSLLLYVDNPKDGYGYRYDEDFTEKMLQAQTSERWVHSGARIGFCRYASARMNFRHQAFLYRPFVSMYYQMYMLAIFYRTRLIQFSGEIGTLAQKIGRMPKDATGIDTRAKQELRDLHRRFMVFMNRHWFVEVTHQDQGIEEFQLMRRALDLDPMYNQVKDEIQRADVLADLIHNQRVEQFNNKVGWFGGIIGFLAVVSGFFGMNFPQFQKYFSTEDSSIIHYWFAGTTSFIAAGLSVAFFTLFKNNRRLNRLYWPLFVFIFLSVYIVTFLLGINISKM